ncbi:hypothetical protein, partial [Saccharopolyspora shandongensis]|uniref:hypothetical protein n=1 Tax=Saccharopolyspora shandongensis TaxID=418495 RepID=UPI0033FE70E2
MSRYRAVDGELEDELARELEDEFEFEDEDELEDFARELEDELEFEDEDELEDELEGLVRELEDELEFEDEDEDEFEDEDELEEEFEQLVRELEAEFEDEDEYFANPARRVYSDAETMAKLAFEAERAETEAEVEGFLGALAPLAMSLAPKVLPLAKKFAPKIIKGVTAIGKKLWRSPTTRRMVRHVPKIAGRTVRDIGRRYANGQKVTGRHIARSLVGHTADAVGGSRGRR